MLYSIEALCAETHNFFESSREIGDYTIASNSISLPFLTNGQIFRIVGSKFNDGVYMYANGSLIRDASWSDVYEDNSNWNAISYVKWNELKHYELIDETFHGAIWPMCVPRAFIKLAHEVAEYEASDASKPTPYLTESISGHYSYTKAAPSDSDWSKVFASKLKRYRKAAVL